MKKGVPQSFQDLKARAAQRLRQGDANVEDDVVAMGDAMLQAGVEPKSAQDRLAKRAWQEAGPQEKQALADMVARMARDDADELTE